MPFPLSVLTYGYTQSYRKWLHQMIPAYILSGLTWGQDSLGSTLARGRGAGAVVNSLATHIGVSSLTFQLVMGILPLIN